MRAHARGVQLAPHLAALAAVEMAAALPASFHLELALPSSASDAASSLCSEAPPSPVNWCAGLGAACRGCAEAFRHTRSAYTELRQDQLDALNRRRQAEMIVFEDTSSSGGGTLSLVPSVASVSAVPSSASAGSSACALPAAATEVRAKPRSTRQLHDVCVTTRIFPPSSSRPVPP